MKTFIKYDYYTQMLVAFSFVVLLIFDIVVLQKGYSWIGYFILAAFHTVSFLIRLLSKKYSKSNEFIVYSGISSTILILLFIVIVFNDVDGLLNWVGSVLMIGIFISPILAMWYLTIVHKDYQESVKEI